jgi:hypothetical protein
LFPPISRSKAASEILTDQEFLMIQEKTPL